MNENLSLYHIFCTAAHAGSISQAAKLLYISQPAVSKAIKRLENNLNSTLFIRTSKGILLTDDGKSLFDSVSFAMESLAMAENALQTKSALHLGHLKIGVSTTLCKHLLLPYLKKFVDTYPHIQISIFCHSTYQTLQQLENHKIDIGYVCEPDFANSFEFLPCDQIEDIFVATPSYLNNLGLRESTLSPDWTHLLQSSDITQLHLMMLEQGNITRNYINRFFQFSHMQQDHILEVNNMDLLIEFAKTSLGIACVIRQFVQDELTSGELIELPLPQSIPGRNVGLIYPKWQTERHSSPVYHFIDFFTRFSS